MQASRLPECGRSPGFWKIWTVKIYVGSRIELASWDTFSSEIKISAFGEAVSSGSGVREVSKTIIEALRFVKFIYRVAPAYGKIHMQAKRI